MRYSSEASVSVASWGCSRCDVTTDGLERSERSSSDEPSCSCQFITTVRHTAHNAVSIHVKPNLRIDLYFECKSNKKAQINNLALFFSTTLFGFHEIEQSLRNDTLLIHELQNGTLVIFNSSAISNEWLIPADTRPYGCTTCFLLFLSNIMIFSPNVIKWFL